MSEIAVKIEGLGKQYHIGRKRMTNSLRQSISENFASSARSLSATIRRQRQPDKVDPTLFWALQDVSFEVQRGEILGLIGRNGSGKSTLLRILARITRPTTGYAEIHGRLGALLEVGTGFHPDLTGRENIYLSGSMIGMKRTEINRLFDSIVDYAGVEKFIDTAVKFYSSGMYVRLAFSVSAHLNTDVLVVDEVLSVGDSLFQAKSAQRMRAAADEGRTVILVAHQMQLIRQICDRVVLMNKGQLYMTGTPEEAVSVYETLK